MRITHCKLLRKQQLRLLEFFVLEVTARSAADILGIQPNTAMLFYNKIRQVISHHVELQATEIFDGAVELDESYFGAARKGKRGRGAAGKVVVFGILKRGGKVFTKVVNDTKAVTLMPLITKKVAPDSVVIRIATAVITHWMSVISIITGSITQRYLQQARITSMASRISGTRPSVC